MTDVYAHRGSRGTHPENTLPAFHAAVQSACEGIELDVHLSSDGQLLVIHDEKVDRTTNGQGLVRDFSLKEIKKLDAGSWFDDSYTFKGVKIPTLQEVLEALKDWGFKGKLNIEIKTDKIVYPGIERKLVDLVHSDAWPFQIIYSSFNPKSLKRLRLLDANAQLGYLASDINFLTKMFLRYYHKDAWHISYRMMKEFSKWKKNYPFARPYLEAAKCRVWTINDPKKMRAVYSFGADAIITDYPERALALRSEIISEKKDLILEMTSKGNQEIKLKKDEGDV
ncbi:glycerophosphodiester phosphodiesterase [Atopobacter sp. AH10]|uniref:glycerophosphodiester phosphodiesterase n=1 Tax=Atopobacter sp. AH10 TaxID=2315861 RepID=UPI000EF23779|nr:glycerophosphodiester phosphodiesterase [Atopobacter sp. AH10]RLK62523.1 glycerophosphodiester phosphodiesterase [Atopobacter sp. AH10]